MDDVNPRASSLAVLGDKILALGTNEEMAKFRGASTVVVDLKGRTLVPGFIDTHQHRVGNRLLLNIVDPRDVIQPAIEQGWTSLDELYVDVPRLNELIALDRSGVLRVRVNAYLSVMENSPEGKLLGDYFNAYSPGLVVSPHVRVAGLKIFTDHENATILLWNQDKLNAFVLARIQEGWQLAIKTVSTRSLEMILQAIEYVETTIPSIANRRVRLEHMLFATPNQIARIKNLGLIPIINLNNPGQLVGDQDVDQLIAREPQGSYAPWRSLAQAGIPFGNATGWPSYYVDEPSGAPFGSPMHLIYQAVTRVGNLGRQPYPWLLDQTLTADEAMHALTINGAHATFEEKMKGSLEQGKLADLVILSDDPLGVSAQQINEIKVLLTMIGGKVEYCAAGHEALCPSASPSAPAPSSTTETSYPSATASNSLADSPPSNVLDGNVDTIWSAGTDPVQWIQIDLGRPTSVSAVRLVISQFPSGETTHQIWGGKDAASLVLIHEFIGVTADPGVLEFKPPSPLKEIRYLKIMTTKSPSWVGWREIEIVATPGG
jgi:hypothetical protein